MKQRNENSSGPAKIRLLQDAIYFDDEELWQLLLRHRTHLHDYFGDLGLELVVHEEDGFAYLRQMSIEDSNGMPRLIRRDKLTKGVAIIGVLLRERLLQFDQTVHDDTRLIIARSDLMTLATPFFPASSDELRSDSRIAGVIAKCEDFGLIRKIGDGDVEPKYEVKRIIKARFPIETLKELRATLLGESSVVDRVQDPEDDLL